MGAFRAQRKLRGGSIDIEWEDGVRRKLQASGILNRLIGFVNGEVKLEPAQVHAALGLIRKVLPDLATVEHKGGQDHNVTFSWKLPSTMSPANGLSDSTIELSATPALSATGEPEKQ